MSEYYLSYTASEIDEKLNKIDRAVMSVNGKNPDANGNVAISASDVDALPSTYTPPNQTAEQVGADPKGTAKNAVANHNIDQDSHNDIRLELKAINDRLTAFFDSDNQTLDELSEIVAYITSNKSLIEAITDSKVSVLDIVNNLTTNVANKPLSAAQGVALKALIDAITIPTKLSQLTNDKGYITGYTETDPTVPAWAKAESKPSYSKSEVGLGNVDNVKQYSASNPPPYPVSSVNGKTGDVKLDIVTDAVRYVEQNLTPEQQAQARKNIGAADVFDPTVYDIPVLYLTGDISPIRISKDNEVTLTYSYKDRNGTCTLKGQGSSSYLEAQKLGDKGKFNYTIKFDTAFEAVDGWGEQKKYCLKANFIDHTHARNVVSAKLWGQMVASRSGVHSTLKSCPNYGAVDGFPIVIMLNGEFHGLYTWNIPKDKWTFNLGSGTKEAVICADVDTPAVDLRVHSTVTEKVDHALEEVTDEDNAGWVATSLNNLIDHCINSYGADLDSTIAQYMDWNSAIDYLILTVLIDGRDMYKKNYIMVTYDGTKWIWSAYDMDSTYGLDPFCREILPANDGISFVKFRVNRVMELIYRFKTNALKTRYKALRSGVLSEENINVMFENFAHGIPSTLYDADIRRWTSVRGSSVVTVDQILRWLTRRIAVVDKWIDELPAQETPVAPSDRTGNVVEKSLDTTGKVYNNVGYKNGYTIEIEGGVESEVAAEGCCITGYIPVTKDNVIHVTTDSWNLRPKNSRIIIYNSNFVPMGCYTQNGFVETYNGYTHDTAILAKDKQSVTYGQDGMTTLNIAYGANCTDLAYIRIRAVGNAANLAVIREGEVPDHAVEPETPAYTNKVPASIDTDRSIFGVDYNGDGVKDGYQDGLRLSSSGATKEHEFSTVTGYIPAKPGDVIRIYGVEWYSDTSNYVCTYDSSFNFLGNLYGAFKVSSTNGTFNTNECSKLNDSDALITLGTSATNSGISDQIAYIRVSSAGLGASRADGIAQTGANMIVTINEEIT